VFFGRALSWRHLLNEDRQRPSRTSSTERTEFERDYDRAVFCTPVRRLQDKAQVFPMEEHDAIRTRLTHSLEVSTVARSLCRAVAVKLAKDGELKVKPDNDQVSAVETIGATCGLLHDLGNPPFGHSGEVAISDWFKVQQKTKLEELGARSQQCADDLRHFDGNAQTMRLVIRLQIFGKEQGLNLTFGTLSALQKYLSASDCLTSRHDTSKPGYFSSENGFIKQLREETRTEGVRHPITFLVEAADDIVYSAVDVEDSIKIHRLRRSQVEGVLLSCKDKLTRQVAQLADKLATDESEDTYGQAFRVSAIQHMVQAVLTEFASRYESIMRGKYHGSLLEDSGAGSLNHVCMDLLKTHVFGSDYVLRMEIKGKTTIHGLMDMFWEGASSCDEDRLRHKEFCGKAYQLISPNYRRVFHDEKRRRSLPELYHRLQLVADYVAGMTDTFASNLHRKLSNG
jgi:dGTPase